MSKRASQEIDTMVGGIPQSLGECICIYIRVPWLDRIYQVRPAPRLESIYSVLDYTY